MTVRPPPDAPGRAPMWPSSDLMVPLPPADVQAGTDVVETGHPGAARAADEDDGTDMAAGEAGRDDDLSSRAIRPSRESTRED